ncbi:MAG: biotin synthase BioB [bacterium]|nr:biotin synthase BioB [bacterium]
MEKIEDYRDLIEMPLDELIVKSNRIRKKHTQKIELCSIINAKSGECTEDCKYCAQSVHHKTDVNVYDLKSKEEIIKKAKNAKEAGAVRYGIVTSGNSLTDAEADIVAEATKEIRETLDLNVCGSFGALSEENLQKLKDAGMTRYHHNLDTSREFYPKIVSTHSFEERINTVNKAKKLGFTVCSGGIIGLGESWDDRISMALILKELDVDSVPINILMPIAGTKLEKNEPIPYADIIRTIAIFRIILQDKDIRLAAGRETKLKDFQGLGFLAGANAMLVGGYLTVNGRNVEEDKTLKKEIEMLW